MAHYQATPYAYRIAQIPESPTDALHHFQLLSAAAETGHSARSKYLRAVFGTQPAARRALCSRVCGGWPIQAFLLEWGRFYRLSGPSPQSSLNTANNQATNAGIQYDAAGNVMNDSIHSYKYDADGNLISVDNGGTAVDVYDALNRRVRVQTASSTDEYIYDYANRRISTWLPNGAGIEGRIYWGSLLTAFRAQNGDTYFDQKDILGTDRLRMNYAAASAANYTSLPFGDDYTANVSGAYGDQDNNHFAQLDRDAESDTDHAQFRQYYNTWGRWMSRDPYNGSYDITNPQSFNRYSCVMNNACRFRQGVGANCTTS